MIDAPIDHIAIVVADLDATIAMYTQTLGFTEVYREIVADQGVEAVGLRTGDAIIELLRPPSCGQHAVAGLQGGPGELEPEPP